jgi:WXG100 family type VII secretion target
MVDVSVDGITVDFNQIEAGSQQIISTARSIDELLDNLHGQIQNLDQIWQGSTSSDYQATKNKWETAAHDLQATLGKIGAAVSAAHQAYLETESKNSAAWS